MKLTMSLKKMLKNRKSDQSGFTLLELLVVVAILAAIAGTAAIALKDTDARASAAAHVAMMDELNKGIRTYRVLQKNTLPTRFDSLMVSAGAYDNSTATGAAGGVGLISVAGFGSGDVETGDLPNDVIGIMVDGGLDALQYINEVGSSDDNDIALGDCDNDALAATINSRANAVVANNIFMSPSANGCGYTVALGGSDGAYTFTNLPKAVYWNGGTERLTGQEDPAGATSAYNADTNYVYLITGIGPSSSLFDANTLGGMTTVPVYRHVGADEYGRFMAVWNVGTYDSSAIVAGDQCELVAIVDGALDTKEEELGEWDGTRNTI